MFLLCPVEKMQTGCVMNWVMKIAGQTCFEFSWYIFIWCCLIMSWWNVLLLICFEDEPHCSRWCEIYDDLWIKLDYAYAIVTICCMDIMNGFPSCSRVVWMILNYCGWVVKRNWFCRLKMELVLMVNLVWNEFKR